MDHPRLEVHIYQISDDSMLKANRSDGTGWDWCWADWQRDWMNNTPHRYAYRCLPLTIANQTGWWIKNPVGFEATWRGATHPGSIEGARVERPTRVEREANWLKGLSTGMILPSDVTGRLEQQDPQLARAVMVAWDDPQR